MYLIGLATHLPSFHYTTQEIFSILEQALPSTSYSLLHRLINRTSIASRNFCLPLEKIIALNSTFEREEVFKKKALELCLEVCEKLFCAKPFQNNPEFFKNSVELFISTCCTIPTLPAVDVSVIQEFGFSNHCHRIPMYQHGCIGGAVSLGLASHFACKNNALILSYELCSLLFNAKFSQAESVLGDVLFGDGVACCYLASSFDAISTDLASSFRPLKIVGSESFIIESTQNLLGYKSTEHGTDLVLKKDLVAKISENIPAFVDSFLKKHGLDDKSNIGWVIHPGGDKIIKGIAQSLNLPSDSTASSWKVLNECGNVSSAGIFFVLEDFIQKNLLATGDKIVLIGVGPGVSVELVLLESI
jgi:alkylresorcinol/alkylpyrone synthase